MNGLQLLDLGYEVEYIEIDTSKVPYNFAVKLGDRTFTFCIRWNDVGGFFTADLSITSTGEVLAYGDIIRYGRPLFNVVEDERFPGTQYPRSHSKTSGSRSNCMSTRG